MRRAYVIVGELEDGKVDTWYGIVHSINAAEGMCLEAEEVNQDPKRHYTWYEVIEEDD